MIIKPIIAAVIGHRSQRGMFLVEKLSPLGGILRYKYSQLPISRTRKGPGKVSDLSEIQNTMQIRHEMRSVS